MNGQSIPIYQLRGSGSFFQRLIEQSAEWKVHWLLRFGILMEFMGHGSFGIQTKAGWLPYFHVFAIPDNVAWKMMPIVGGIDVAIGLITAITPRRAFLFYMTIWGCFTALLRPAAGEGGWEFIERAYNFGVPAALLFLHGVGHNWKTWIEPLNSIPSLSEKQTQKLLWMLRGIVVLMLIGHGGYGAFMAKRNLLGFYQSAGFSVFGIPLETIRAAIGFLEIGLGVASFFILRPGFFIFIFLWKLGSELLFPLSSANGAWLEVLERGGSYVAPLALYCLLQQVRIPLDESHLEVKPSSI